MSFTEYLKQTISNFFIVVTLVSVAMATAGLIVSPDTRFSYAVLYSPFLFGLISVLPSLVFYSKKELSLKAQLIRNILHLLLIEILIVSALKLLNNISLVESVALMISILIVYVLATFITWLLDSRLANSLTKSLRNLQDGGE